MDGGWGVGVQHGPHGVQHRSWGRQVWVRVSSTAQGGSMDPGGLAWPRLQQVPDVQAAPHGVGDALLEAEPDVAPAHCGAHALLGRVSLRGCVLCRGHTVVPPPDPDPSPSTAPTSPHTCARGCCSLDNNTTEEVPLRLKEIGWSGSWGLTHSRQSPTWGEGPGAISQGGEVSWHLWAMAPYPHPNADPLCKSLHPSPPSQSPAPCKGEVQGGRCQHPAQMRN